MSFGYGSQSSEVSKEWVFELPAAWKISEQFSLITAYLSKCLFTIMVWIGHVQIGSHSDWFCYWLCNVRNGVWTQTGRKRWRALLLFRQCTVGKSYFTSWYITIEKWTHLHVTFWVRMASGISFWSSDKVMKHLVYYVQYIFCKIVLLYYWIQIKQNVHGELQSLLPF